MARIADLRMTLSATLGGILAVGLLAPAASAASPDYLGTLPPKVKGVPKVVKTTCSACHGMDGNSVGPTFPNLAGQNYNYLLKQLEDFRSGARSPATMSQMIKSVPKAADNANLKQIAAYFSQQKLKRGPGQGAKPSKKLAETGYQLYVRGSTTLTQFLIVKKDVPSCAACHSPNGEGNPSMAIPALAGQHAMYIDTELKRFASGTRHNGPSGIMAAIAAPLTATQMKAVAAYVSVMNPELIVGSGPKTYKDYAEALKGQPVPGVKSSALAGGGKH